MTEPDTRFMQRALTLARRGQGRVEPNPMVGAVITRDGKIIAEGYHRRYGSEHAEIVALQKLRRTQPDASRCTLYVTLEPCSHHGKTPPCVDALIESGVQRVVAGMQDPNPTVHGRGFDTLRQAGISVDVGICEPQARRLNEPYIKRVHTGLPWMIGKWAQTIDGRIATRTGDSRWISNPTSRKWVHRLRARVDVVMVGIGTVLKDDPRLTARDAGIKRPARRVVVDPHLKLPPDARVLNNTPDAPDAPPSPPLTVAIDERVHQARPIKLTELERRGVEFVALPPSRSRSGRLSLFPLMRYLADVHNATNVLVEGGGGLIGSLMDQRLLDQIYVFIAPKAMGDERATPALRGYVTLSVNDAPGLELIAVKRFAEDVLLDYRIPPPNNTHEDAIVHE